MKTTIAYSLLLTLMAASVFTSCSKEDDEVVFINSPEVNTETTETHGLQYVMSVQMHNDEYDKNKAQYYLPQVGKVYNVNIKAKLDVDKEHSDVDASVKSIDCYWDDEFVTSGEGTEVNFIYNVPLYARGQHKIRVVCNLQSPDMKLDPHVSIFSVYAVDFFPCWSVDFTSPDVVRNKENFTLELQKTKDNTMGKITKVQFYIDSDALGTIYDSPYRITTQVDKLKKGEHQFRAVVVYEMYEGEYIETVTYKNQVIVE